MMRLTARRDIVLGSGKMVGELLQEMLLGGQDSFKFVCIMSVKDVFVQQHRLIPSLDSSSRPYPALKPGFFLSLYSQIWLLR